MMYMQTTLDAVILNYSTLDYTLFQNRLLDQTLNEKFDELNENFDEVETIYELFGDRYNLIKYNNAVKRLMNGNVKEAKSMLLDLVNEAVQPAYYALVVVFFKETIGQCNVLNFTTENVELMKKNKDEIVVAVQLLKRARLMEPACSFLLGMLKRYNIGECSQFMGGSWIDDLIHVVNVARTHDFFNIEHYILMCIDNEKSWNYERYGSGMEIKQKYLKEISKYSLYEITLSMLSEQHFHPNALKGLFEILCELEFPEALYRYGAALLESKCRKTPKENMKDAMGCLNRAISKGHEGAKFLLGTLGFNSKFYRILRPEEIEHCILTLEDYINDSNGLCTMNEKNIDKAAYCLAAEYYTKMSYFVLQDKQKATEMLNSRKLYEKLHDLQSRAAQFAH